MHTFTTYTALFVLGMLISFSIGAQVRLEGIVSHGGDPLNDVTIKVKENEKVLRTLQANKKGKYETEVPFNRRYTLVFMRPFMYPVSIIVDTKVEDEEDVIYEVPLNMELVYRYPGMDKKGLSEAVGIVSKTGEGTKAFTFVPNQASIKAYNSLKSESEKHEAKGEDPVESSIETSKPTQLPIDDLSAKSEPDRSELVKKESSNKSSKVAAEDKNTRAEERYSVIEEAKTTQATNAQENKARKAASSEQSDDELASYIEDQKLIRSQLAQEQAQEMSEISRARDLKYEELEARGYAGVNSKRQRVSTSAELVSFSTDAGVILTEERVLLQRGEIREQYVKATYDWVVFEYNSFTKNGNEITEEEYESIKDELGI